MLRRLFFPKDPVNMPATSLRSRLCPSAPCWSNRYQCSRPVVPRLWKNWLQDKGSLTRRLQSIGRFSVQLRQQGYGFASAMECRDLGLTYGRSVWFREVALLIDDQEVVLARTVVPLNSWLARRCGLTRLGNRSLGTFLFSQPSMKRPTLRLYRWAADGQHRQQWARRSIFTIQGQPLQVTEAFNSEWSGFSRSQRPLHRIHSNSRR